MSEMTHLKTFLLMKNATLIFFFLILSLVTLAQDINVPKGVVYKYSSDKINNKAKEVIKKELSNSSTYIFFDKLVYCGP
jgi:hypothetical protein